MGRFIVSGHHIDANLTPIYSHKLGIAFTFNVNNSEGQAIVTFGGWIFPIDNAADHAVLKIGVRDLSGDNITTVIDLSATETHPVWRVAIIQRISGTDFDLGSGGYVDANANGDTSALDNGGRWVANVGVARTVQRTTRVRWGPGNSSSEHLAPLVSADIDMEISITAIFSG